MLRIVPLGGLGEIGLNAMVIEFGADAVLVDAGLLFPGDTMPGVDHILPDFAYLRERPGLLKGVALTHAHEDHLGALTALLREFPVPVYGAPFTLALARHKLEEAGIAADLREVGPREPFRVSEHLSLEAVQTCHSAPDAFGYLVQTPSGTVVHTGDYKVDPAPPDGRVTDLDRYREAGERGVLCLLADSTASEVVGSTGSESRVAQALHREIAASPARVVVSLFASNVVRLQAVFDASAQAGRRVAVAGRSMARNVEIARRLGLLRFADEALVPLDAAASLPRERLTLLSTGSQAEPRSGLFQLLNPDRELRLEEGDTVILSARPIPGNERAVARMIDALSARGARVVHAGPVPDLHVSGHASPDQQRQVISAVRPQNFIPIHGELHHLHAQLATARGCGVPDQGLLLARDGDVVGFTEGRAVLADRIAAGRIVKDLFGTGAMPPESVSERVRLAETGVVVAAIVYDRAHNALAAPPSLEGRGLALEEMAALPRIAEEVRVALSEVSDHLLADEAFAREELTRLVRRSFKALTGKRPAVVPVVMKL